MLCQPIDGGFWDSRLNLEVHDRIRPLLGYEVELELRPIKLESRVNSSANQGRQGPERHWTGSVMLKRLQRIIQDTSN